MNLDLTRSLLHAAENIARGTDDANAAELRRHLMDLLNEGIVETRISAGEVSLRLTSEGREMLAAIRSSGNWLRLKRWIAESDMNPSVDAMRQGIKALFSE